MTQTTTGLYTLDSTQGDVRIAKNATPNPGGLQNTTVSLNLNNVVGGPVTGDFSTQIQFSNVVIFPQTVGLDQIEFQTAYQNSSIFYNSLDHETSFGGRNVHVWNGSVHGVVLTNATSGTFRITRLGSALSGYFNNQLLFSQTNTAALSAVRFVVQNHFGSNDRISATFDNFFISVGAAEPGTVSLFAIAGVFFAQSWVRRRTA